MLLQLYRSADGIKGKLGHLLTLCGNGPIIYEGLKSLSIFTLQHHAELLPGSMAVISLLSVNVEGFQEVESPGLEHSSPQMEWGSFLVVMKVRGHGITVGNAGKTRETSLSMGEQGGTELSTMDLFRYTGNV